MHCMTTYSNTLLPCQHLRQPDIFTGQALLMTCSLPCSAQSQLELYKSMRPSHSAVLMITVTDLNVSMPGCIKPDSWPSCELTVLHSTPHPFANTPTRADAMLKHTEHYRQLYDFVQKP